MIEKIQSSYGYIKVNLLGYEGHNIVVVINLDRYKLIKKIVNQTSGEARNIAKGKRKIQLKEYEMVAVDIIVIALITIEIFVSLQLERTSCTVMMMMMLWKRESLTPIKKEQATDSVYARCAWSHPINIEGLRKSMNFSYTIPDERFHS